MLISLYLKPNVCNKKSLPRPNRITFKSTAMTKEEILAKNEIYGNPYVYSHKQVINAMQEYATQEKEELEAENFRLAAMACFQPTSDDWANRTCDDKPQCTMIERVRELEATQEKQGWVKTSERLPEVANNYLVYIPDFIDPVTTREYSPEFGRFLDVRITHWMPMPKKPEV